MAKITVTGYEVACDPGINHFTTYRGEPIDVNDIQPGMNLERLITDSWWRSAVSHKLAALTLVELRDTGVVLHYGINDIFVEFGHSKQIDKVGLSYAYGDLWVKVEP